MIAISYKDFDLYGCPNCGCDIAISGNFMSCGVTTGTCEECGKTFVLLPDNITKSSVGFGTDKLDDKGQTIYEYPERVEHPRKDIPKHAYVWPDPRPEDGIGEFWLSRGLGMGYSRSLGEYKEDCSGFVKSKKAGERLLEMVHTILGKSETDSFLDYRENEPKWIQFKFLSTEFNLRKLNKLVNNNNGVINSNILTKCKL